MTIAQSVGIITQRAGRNDSPLEAHFARDARALKFPPWERNCRFCEGRKFELDFAWPALKLAVEIDGAVHRTVDRFHTDREKGAYALLLGWTVLHVTGRHVRDGRAVRWAEALLLRALGLGGKDSPENAFSGTGNDRLSDSSDSGVGRG